MKKCVINDEKSAIEYIHYVLNEWGEWKTHHTTLVQALEILVNRDKRIEDNIIADTVKKMIQRIKEDAIAVSLLSNPPKFMLEIREDALDQIANEMLEGADGT